MKILRTSKDSATALVFVDYGQNYSFVVQDAIQSYHWNNSQATIHPFFVRLWCPNLGEEGNATYKTYFIISDERSHDASTFHTFRTMFVEKLKIDFPFITKLIYVSDGTAAQYKNTHNLMNLLFHRDEYGLEAEWHFTATSHGKSECDAMSAVVKSSIRLKSLKGQLITTPKSMFDVAVKEMTEPGRLEFIYVTKDNVTETKARLQPRYDLCKIIYGTRACHGFRPVDKTSLKMFKYSANEEFKLLHAYKSNTEISGEEELAGVQLHLETIFKVGNYYAVRSGRFFQIGIMIQINNYEREGELLMMKRSGKNWVFPHPEKTEHFNYEDILCQLQPPTRESIKSIYKFTKEDTVLATEKMKLSVSNQ
ncbi:hypothetical protein Fcan01_27325 [Folsomia candida]|uniref:Uncharacterized protein n=1 Tax=Folsomia candida TaxID=158441 RepID=A0A226CZ99_FOLCA|nr:hypothetical protein Fcan01_27325 [Folsomia candida]